jgi:hypothetical protein
MLIVRVSGAAFLVMIKIVRCIVSVTVSTTTVMREKERKKEREKRREKEVSVFAQNICISFL